ncbi:putative bifunctional diguanylate cyclase/phosphodiesterase [Kineococcus rubinsiae]|uniref:putative bifunctional diguanylate cyclase/phosphodiesterase n=1 Tax=Kineococcus rubinsiae TaxID=2609562 RepID=UPI00142FFA8A|nr:bifunctional diguanylate cyclase/phosphodiesterase [Kineococcus rubinsiae]
MTTYGWRAHLVAGAVLVLAYTVLPAGLGADAVYQLVAVSAAVAILVGVRRHRPTHRHPWLLLAGGQLLWAAGDGLWNWYADVAHTDPYPSGADVAYLAAYPVLGAGLFALVRLRQRTLDAGAVIESLVVTVGLSLLSWVGLAGPVFGDPDSGLLVKAVGVAYPLGDILLVGLLVRLVTTPGARTPAFRLLTAGALLLPAADSLFLVQESVGSASLAHVADALWLGSYLLFGAAALHPSMAVLASPGGEASKGFSRLRLPALAAAALVAPGVLAVELALGVPVHGGAVVTSTVSLILLVSARMHLALRWIAQAATQREELRRDLERSGSTDPLTDLANRSGVQLLLDDALERGRRHRVPVGLLVLDVDRFGDVNDAWGHRAGDEVLRGVAQQLRRVVRTDDTVGRLGSDEFVVVVADAGSEQDLRTLAGRLTQLSVAVSGPADGTLRITASVGAVVDGGAEAGLDGAEFLRRAALAASRAKGAGGARVEVFDADLLAEVRAQADVEAAVRHGLGAGEFSLHYQPVVDLASGRTASFEALLRWHRPGHGPVPPDAFIPVAERSSLVCEVGRWVLDEAARQLALWNAGAGPCGRVRVAVNVSGRHLAEPSVVQDVVDALARWGVPASDLGVEVTETVLLDERAVAGAVVQLRALGVRLSIDDFGTGYTSISQLRHLTADTLKIDRSFVAASAGGGRELLGLIVRAAHAVGLEVVAEGVEEQAQLDLLRELGCDAAQGWLFARAVPAAAVRLDGPALTGPAITSPALTGPAITDPAITGPAPALAVAALAAPGAAGPRDEPELSRPA